MGSLKSHLVFNVPGVWKVLFLSALCETYREGCESPPGLFALAAQPKSSRASAVRLVCLLSGGLGKRM